MDTLKSHYNELLNFVRKLSPEAVKAIVRLQVCQERQEIQRENQERYFKGFSKRFSKHRIGMQSGESSCRTKFVQRVDSNLGRSPGSLQEERHCGRLRLRDG